MVYRQFFIFLLALSLLANALCVPPNFAFRRRRDSNDNGIDSSKLNNITGNKGTTSDPSPTDTKPSVTHDDDDDDDFDDDNFKPSTTSNSGGGAGSNIFSLINLASAFLPSLSGSNNAQKADGATSPFAWPLWTLKMDIIRAVMRYGMNKIGLASAGLSSGSPNTQA